MLIILIVTNILTPYFCSCAPLKESCSVLCVSRGPSKDGRDVQGIDPEIVFGYVGHLRVKASYSYVTSIQVSYENYPHASVTGETHDTF